MSPWCSVSTARSRRWTQGALWNGGVFAYKLGYVMDKAHEMMDFTDYIKPFVDKFEQQIMFAEKSWGSFKVVDVETTSLTIKVIIDFSSEAVRASFSKFMGSVFFSEFCSFFNSSFKWAKESNEELTDFTNNCSQKLIQSSSLAALEFKSIVLSM